MECWRSRHAESSDTESVCFSSVQNVPCSPFSQLHHQSVAGTSTCAIYAPFCLCGLVWVGQRCKFPSAMISAGINPLSVKMSRKVCRGLFMILSLTAKAFDKCGNFLRPPDCCSGTELHGFGITSCATSLPPCTLAYGNHAENLRQTQKAVDGNGCLMLFHKKIS